MEYSLFSEAARDYEAEAAERRTALVRATVKEEIFPFLAMAASDAEYGHRKALAADRLHAIARRCETSVKDVESAADRMYRLLAQARRNQMREARLEQRTAAMQCGNCGHGSVDHSEGLQCHSCGCTNFTPQSTGKEGRRITAENEEGPFS